MSTLVLKVPAVPERSYEIQVEPGLMERVAPALAADAGEHACYWIWDQAVWGLWRETAMKLGWPVEGSRRHLLFEGTEQKKRLAAIERLATALVERNADRGSALVAVGGGVTGDVVGFLAAIYMRGVPFYQLPTTLLAQVDSSVGGKTGVDLAVGKNLLGCFHQPRAVWIDPNFLTTLPLREFRQGLAEVVKTALLGSEDLWDFLEREADALMAGDVSVRSHMITACCRIKAEVVAADEREAGRRRVLNLGHTVGHALERLSGYALAHGDAVAMGLVAAAEWPVKLGVLERSLALRLIELCRTFGLPTQLPAAASGADIVEALRSDKKYVAGRLHFILPVRIGQVTDRTDLDPAQLRTVLDRLRAA